MKVPEPIKLKSGNYFIQLRLGGVSTPVTASTAKACKYQAQLIKSEYLAGKREFKSGNITLRQAIDKYIASRNGILSPSTIYGYKCIQEKRFSSVMDKKLKSISDWQTVCDEESKICGARTLRNAYHFIASVLEYNGVKPETVTLPQVPDNTKAWLEPEQIVKLVASSAGTKYALPVMLALHSLRRSEIAGLTWDKLDLEKETIEVRGAVVQGEGHRFVDKKTNKNSSSARTIKIVMPELVEELRAVDDKTGKVLTCSPDTICNRINTACRLAGLPEVGTHGLRHSFASLAYHLGMTELETMEMGGWSDPGTMRKIYTHLSEVDRLAAENKMSNFYKNKSKKQE